jgi:hypothetical protein
MISVSCNRFRLKASCDLLANILQQFGTTEVFSTLPQATMKDSGPGVVTGLLVLEKSPTLTRKASLAVRTWALWMILRLVTCSGAAGLCVESLQLRIPTYVYLYHIKMRVVVSFTSSNNLQFKTINVVFY